MTAKKRSKKLAEAQKRYYNKNRKPPKKNEKKIIIILYLLSLALLFEWFINRPTLRYGGYYLYALHFLYLLVIFLALEKLNLKKLKNIQLP